MVKPIISRERIKALKKEYYIMLKSKLKHIKISKEFYGPTPPYLLVGAYNYPRVRIGSILSLGKPELSSNPSLMYGEKYSNIITQFGMNMMGVNRTHILNRQLYDTTDSIMSYKPVGMEVLFKFKPELNPRFSMYSIPSGYCAPVQKIKLTENPKIPRVTYNMLNDDVKANYAVPKITEKTDVYYAMRLLTAGILGEEKNKKLVPTRWAITAVDDILTKHYMEKIRQFNIIPDYEVYTNEFLHNRFVIVLIPGPWQYEQYEAWPYDSQWSTEWGFNQEFESFKGRKKYAEKQGGGYYAARYGVAEHLYIKRKQAKAIVFREIDQEYSIPVGVWQVRENVRKAMQKQPKKFNNLRDVFHYIKPLLRIQLDKYLKKSETLKQQSLFEF